MKKRLLSILMALALCLMLLPTTALADEGTSPVTFKEIDGTAGANEEESYSNLFDGKSGTKWCVTGFNNDGAYVIFKASAPMQVGGYAITTGNDNNINPGRNPKDWVLYGSTATVAPGKDSESWEVIHKVTNDAVLQDENFTTYNFTLANPTTTEYQYFKLEITAVQNIHNTNIMQISEFVLTSCNHNWKTVTVPGTKDELGYTTKTCTICHQEETQFDLTNAMTLVLSNNGGNGWGGAELQIHRNGQEWKKLALEDNSNSQTVYLPYSEDSDYSFYWKQGNDIKDDIVLDILFGIDKVFTSNNLKSVGDGALLFQLNTVKIPFTTTKIPFTTTVKLGDAGVPGETTFDLEIVGNNAGGAEISDVTVTGSVTTNGAGDYEGVMTITGPERQLWYMLSEGAFVQQVNVGEEGWTYDDTVYGLLISEIAAYSTADSADYTVLILPAICEETENGMYYDLDWEAEPLERMSFTNTYTKSTTEPTENNPGTGDNSNPALWFALFSVSAAGVIGTGVYGKRRRSSRAK